MTNYMDFGDTAEYYGWGAVPDAWGAMGDAMAAPGSAILDFLGQAGGFLGQAARGFPDYAPTPGSNQLTGSETRGGKRVDRELGWQAPQALGGGGAGRAARGSSQEAINQAQSAAAALGDPHGGWWDRMQDRVYNFGADVVGGAGDVLGGVGEVGQWWVDPMYQAGQELLEGDLSGAIGDYLGGRFDQARDVAGVAGNVVAPALGYLGQEVGQLAGDFGRNLYQNWGLEDLLQAAGGFAQDLPGYGLDALNYLGDYALEQGENVAKWGGSQLLNLGSEVGDFVTQQAVPYFQQDFIEDVTNLGKGVADWAVDDAWGEAIQPFYENVLKPAGLDIADWAVDDVYKDVITPLYENYLKPAGLEIADFTSENANWPYIRDQLRHDISDVLEKVPAFIRDVAPEGSMFDNVVEGIMDARGWTWDRKEDLFDYITGTGIGGSEWAQGRNMRDDLSDLLEQVPAGLRGLFPEGSRLDDWMESGVGGVGAGFDWLTETAPGAAADLAGRSYDYLFDPSQPSFKQGPGKAEGAALQQFTPEERAYFEQAAAAGFFGPSGAAAGGAIGGAPAGAGAVAGGSVPAAAGGVVPAGPMMSAEDVANQIYNAAEGAGGGGLSDLYSQMYDAQRTWAQDAYGAQMRGAEAAGQASQDYAASILQQGEQAAAQAEAVANQYYVQGADEAARAYNETVGALNNREQGLIQKYSELAAIEAAGAGNTATEQRRVSAELEALQTQRTSLRHGLIMEGLTEEEARRTTRLDEFEGVRKGRLASDEAALIQMISGLETGRVGQERAMAEQLATRFSGARAGMQQRLEAAEATLRAQGIEPAAYTAAPGAETQALLTSQELSMQTLQNRLRDASAAQAIDRQMRGSEIYSAAGRALEDNLFAMRSQLEDSIAQRKGIANLDTFDRQADIDIAGAAERGDINLQELAALQASKEAMFGRKTDLFGESELNRIYTRSDYNAALATERAAQQRAMERAQEQRIVAQAAAAQQAFAGEQSRLQREHEAAISAKETAAAIAQAESATEIAQIEAAAAEAQRLSEDYLMVNVDGVDVPVDRDWYIEEYLIGPGAGSDLSSDVNLVEMVDNAGNSFFVDVGGVDELGNPYLNASAATNLQITGDPLTPAWAE